MIPRTGLQPSALRSTAMLRPSRIHGITTGRRKWESKTLAEAVLMRLIASEMSGCEPQRKGIGVPEFSCYRNIAKSQSSEGRMT